MSLKEYLKNDWEETKARHPAISKGLGKLVNQEEGKLNLKKIFEPLVKPLNLGFAYLSPIAGIAAGLNIYWGTKAGYYEQWDQAALNFGLAAICLIWGGKLKKK